MSTAVVRSRVEGREREGERELECGQEVESESERRPGPRLEGVRARSARSRLDGLECEAPPSISSADITYHGMAGQVKVPPEWWNWSPGGVGRVG